VSQIPKYQKSRRKSRRKRESTCLPRMRKQSPYGPDCPLSPLSSHKTSFDFPAEKCGCIRVDDMDVSLQHLVAAPICGSPCPPRGRMRHRASAVFLTCVSHFPCAAVLRRCVSCVGKDGRVVRTAQPACALEVLCPAFIRVRDPVLARPPIRPGLHVPSRACMLDSAAPWQSWMGAASHRVARSWLSAVPARAPPTSCRHRSTASLEVELDLQHKALAHLCDIVHDELIVEE